MKLRVGDICRLSVLGLACSPKTRWETALVFGKGASYRVLPEGQNDAVHIHWSYLDLVVFEDRL